MIYRLACFVVYLLCISGTEGFSDYECPSSWPSGSCRCEAGFWSLEISCGGADVDQVREALTTASQTGHPLGLVLECAELSSLPSYLPKDVNLKQLRVRGCNDASGLDENSFAAVADQLKVLDLSGNDFERVPGQALGNLTSLEHLYFMRNKLQFLHAGAFKGLQSLRTLNLRDNSIEAIDDLALEGFGSRFWNLDLQDNQLKAIPVSPLRNLSSLEYLYLENNRITDLQPEGFADTEFGESLTLLKLRNNRIRSLPPRAFLSLRKVYFLDFTGNEIESIDPFAFQGMEIAMRDLHLGSNRLTEVPAAALRNLTYPRLINLPSNRIREVRKDDFLPYGKSLTHIFLQRNSITHVHPEAFFGLDRLSSLGLQHNQLNTLPYDTYSSVLDTMNLLEVHGNPFYCDCQMNWLVEYMKGQGADVVEWQSDIKCAHPVELQNMELKNVPEDKLTCPNTTS